MKRRGGVPTGQRGRRLSTSSPTLPCRTRVVRTSVVIGQVALNPRHESRCRVVGAVALVIPFDSPRAQTRQVDHVAVAELHRHRGRF